MVMGVTSLAVPENDGVVSFDGDGGWFSVKAGASVAGFPVAVTPANGAAGRRTDAPAAGTPASESAIAKSSPRRILRAPDRDFTCTTRGR